ncbi:hypothetical protein PN462_01985 [Spirulina sp. CS-785/01]|uniref:hypothetical protein n=1 Tax=Spirulina sp. CS-785/01 TaxID=3021716 RepID=UPI0023302D93|nr:hypothetical protein [Spirulina sp. CS-785/01]MDB9311855.1 hypothetical protein [Spirulina sp. CS-785/01]
MLNQRLLATITATILPLTATAAPDFLNRPAQAQDSEKLAELRQQIYKLAQQTSQFLQEEAARKFLKTQIAESPNREQILLFRNFLEQASERFPQAKELLAQVERIESQMSQQNVGVKPRLDFYIPDPEMRREWQGGEILVGADPVLPEEQVEALKAFTLEGEAVTLSPHEPPNTPLLMIAIEEHLNHKPPEASAERFPESQAPPEEDPQEPQASLPRTALNAVSVKNSVLLSQAGSVGVPYLQIIEDRESRFWRGAPEIVLQIYRGNTTDTLNVRFASSFLGDQDFDLEGEWLHFRDHNAANNSRALPCGGWLKLNATQGNNRTCLYWGAKESRFDIRERDPKLFGGSVLQYIVGTDINPGNLSMVGYDLRSNQRGTILVDTDSINP